MAGHSGFLGMTWDAMRAEGALRSRGGCSTTTLTRTAEHLVEASWRPRGSSDPIHEHGASAASVLVLEGEIVEERWTRGGDGAWTYARRTLRAGDETHLPPGAFHRIAAVRDTNVITTYSPPPAPAPQPVDPVVLAVLELARTGHRDASSTSVGAWAPSAEDVAASDA